MSTSSLPGRRESDFTGRWPFARAKRLRIRFTRANVLLAAVESGAGPKLMDEQGSRTARTGKVERRERQRALPKTATNVRDADTLC